VFVTYTSEGKTLANDSACKYTEVSAILNHKVDDLLVGMLKQIRLSAELHRQHRHQKGRRDRDRSLPPSRMTTVTPTVAPNDHTTGGCLTKARNRVLAKLLRVGSKHRAAQASKSCENLLSLWISRTAAGWQRGDSCRFLWILSCQKNCWKIVFLSKKISFKKQNLWLITCVLDFFGGRKAKLLKFCGLNFFYGKFTAVCRNSVENVWCEWMNLFVNNRHSSVRQWTKFKFSAPPTFLAHDAAALNEFTTFVINVQFLRQSAQPLNDARNSPFTGRRCGKHRRKRGQNVTVDTDQKSSIM